MGECGEMELGKNKSDNNEMVEDIEQNNSRDANVAPISISGVARWISMSRKPLLAIMFVVLSPIAALCFMIWFLWGWRSFIVAEDEDKCTGSFYEKVHMYRSPVAKVRAGSAVVTCRLGCVLLLWLVLSISTLRPALKTVMFLGLIHWKWFLLATFVILSHPFIAFNLYIYGYIYHNFLVDRSSQLYYYNYYIWEGLSDSIASLLHVSSVFLLWMLYFHAHVGLNAGFDKYATRTLVALLVSALLWLLKTALLLRWEQKAVYEKFRPRILMCAFRLFNLLCFFDSKANNVLLPCMFQDEEHFEDATKVREYRESPFFSKRNAREYIVSSAHVSLDQMKSAAEMLTLLTKTPRSGEDAHQLSAILDAYQQKIVNTYSDPKEATTEIIIRDYLSESTCILLKDVVRAEYPTKDLNQVPFDKWMVDAHKSCTSVAYTLTDAFAMVSALDTILTSCQVMAVIVVWLLVTELASTTLLVVIASPFLALSFVFGDVCKNFFQGFIFAFVAHPFDIGDRCIINGDEVEVKRVSIMVTTCLKIGTNEKIMYPNSSLATNSIINLGDKLDPNDVIELVLHPSTKMNDILDMKKHINSFINSDEEVVLFEKAHKVVVKEIKNGIKIIIYFQHIMDGKDISFSQFLEKKEEHRSIIFIEIKRFLETLGVEVATL